MCLSRPINSLFKSNRRLFLKNNNLRCQKSLSLSRRTSTLLKLTTIKGTRLHMAMSNTQISPTIRTNMVLSITTEMSNTTKNSILSKAKNHNTIKGPKNQRTIKAKQQTKNGRKRINQHSQTNSGMAKEAGNKVIKTKVVARGMTSSEVIGLVDNKEIVVGTKDLMILGLT